MTDPAFASHAVTILIGIALLVLCLAIVTERLGLFGLAILLGFSAWFVACLPPGTVERLLS